MLNIIVWTAIAIINWFNPNLDIFPKIMFTLAAMTISVQALHIKQYKDFHKGIKGGTL